MAITAAVIFEKNIFGMAIINTRFLMYPYLTDGMACTTLKDILIQERVDVLLVCQGIDEMRAKSIMEIKNCRSYVISKTKFSDYLFKKCNPISLGGLKDAYGMKALNALADHLECIGFIVDKFQNRLGYIDAKEVIIKENKSKMLLSPHTMDGMRNLGNSRTFFCQINYTVTKAGSDTLKSWLRTPLIKLKAIEERHTLQRKLYPHVTFIRSCLHACKMPQFNKALNIQAIKNLLENTLRVYAATGNIIPLQNADRYLRLWNLLPSCFGESIPLRYDKKFDELNALVDDLPEILNRTAAIVAEKFGVELKIIYFPQIGYVFESRELDFLTTQIEEDEDLAEINLGPTESKTEFSRTNCDKSGVFSIHTASKTFEFEHGDLIKLKFTLDSKYYYKTNETYILDQKYGDVVLKIKERELELRQKIELDIINTNFADLVDYIGMVDATCSLVMYSNENKCTKAILTILPNEKCQLDFDIPENSVPFFDIKGSYLTMSLPKNSIITSCTPFIDKIAKICVLAQMGACVPCKKANLPIFKNIFLCKSKPAHHPDSTFQLEMKNIGNILHSDLKNALILLENVCESTNDPEGRAIFCGIHNFISKYHSITVTNLAHHHSDFQQFFFYNNKVVKEIPVDTSLSKVKKLNPTDFDENNNYIEVNLSKDMLDALNKYKPK